MTQQDFAIILGIAALIWLAWELVPLLMVSWKDRRDHKPKK